MYETTHWKQRNAILSVNPAIEILAVVYEEKNIGSRVVKFWEMVLVRFEN